MPHSTFSLRLSPDECDVPHETAQPSILIIEEQNDWARNTADRLEMHRIDTILADNTERGLAIARSRRPAAILLDLRIPTTSSLCRDLASDPATRDIPRVGIGSGGDFDSIQAAREHGCHYFIAQPCDPSVLLVLVNHVAQRHLTVAEQPSITV